ncbi:uncharacterized protein MONBRDRAFT_30748 [Monosiga brevicollis MX1]|uniref:ATP synthase subunit n=1 Tax=Monosiga brevicollis TaxID=81824 RepID=A9UNY8_MONBE|nr:uncharacterized protein MONBRDRAFT_30748 [Monosiga brevicollis MX1]EDQ92782.1 predicted protein [Monosiga brevicollis MX1]|eukprot:XP_001742544.1 hypothetical protein [Monosiga brevicollis MX1]
MASKIPQVINMAQVAGRDLVVAAKPVVSRFAALASKELAPPSPAQWPQIKKGLTGLAKDAQSLKFMNLTVKEAASGALVGVEVAMWFFFGEIIGKGSIIGYDV